jgi:hypothetical protein
VNLFVYFNDYEFIYILHRLNKISKNTRRTCAIQLYLKFFFLNSRDVLFLIPGIVIEPNFNVGELIKCTAGMNCMHCGALFRTANSWSLRLLLIRVPGITVHLMKSTLLTDRVGIKTGREAATVRA